MNAFIPDELSLCEKRFAIKLKKKKTQFAHCPRKIHQ